jgi:hypothetical protein
MSNSNSLYNGFSRYVHGGATETDGNRIEWWERATFTQDASDTIYVVENFYEGRLDNISAVFYGEPRFWWFLAQYNNILDPISEITAGRILYIPSKVRLESILIGRKGGLDSKRELTPIISPVVV